MGSPKRPININKETCSPVSSNCVIWQGPDIPCLNLCKGATITEVVYELATEFCNLYAQFDPTGYNYDCLNIEGCPPETFKDLFQILINRVCSILNNQPSEGNGCGLVVNIEPTSSGLMASVSGGSGNYTYQWSTAQNAFKGIDQMSPATLTNQEVIFIRTGCDEDDNTSCILTSQPIEGYIQPSFYAPTYSICWVTDTETGCTQQGTYMRYQTYFN
jgi:hypothetical protein